MARPPRLEFPGGVYHVVVRGNERAAVFRDDEDREKYLGRLAFYRAYWGQPFIMLLRSLKSAVITSDP